MSPRPLRSDGGRRDHRLRHLSGGKPLLSVIAATRLIEVDLIEHACWIVLRDSLRLPGEEAFADPVWRTIMSHRLVDTGGRQHA